MHQLIIIIYIYIYIFILIYTNFLKPPQFEDLRCSFSESFTWRSFLTKNTVWDAAWPQQNDPSWTDSQRPCRKQFKPKRVDLLSHSVLLGKVYRVASVGLGSVYETGLWNESSWTSMWTNAFRPQPRGSGRARGLYVARLLGHQLLALIVASWGEVKERSSGALPGRGWLALCHHVTSIQGPNQVIISTNLSSGALPPDTSRKALGGGRQISSSGTLRAQRRAG